MKPRLNPLLAVTLAAFAVGLAAGMSPIAVLRALGHAFNASRYVSVLWLVLPVIGLLERAGLQERARTLVARSQGASAGRLLIGYMALRQLSAALGLAAIAGQAQTVRPIVAPMAEAASGAITAPVRERVRATAAATDNIGVFFGEDIFVAMSSILLIQACLAANGIAAAPLQLSHWAIPTALAALLVHGARLLRLDRRA